MKHSSKALKAAAKSLRAARDLMNSGGLHWIKGAEKMWVDQGTHTPGDYGDYSSPSNAPLDTEVAPAFCSVGALKEVSADDVAVIALADLMAPQEMAEWRELLREDAVEYYAITGDEIDEYVENGLREKAFDAIIGFNDDHDRSWDEVKDAFTRAAKRLTDRAR